VKNFEDAVFSLKDNELSGVVTTEYGFHIIQVLERQAPHIQTLDEVKSQIIASLRNQTVFDRMQELADQAHAELAKAPQNAQQIAAKLDLSFVNVARYAAGGPIPGLGTDAQVGAAIEAMKPGEVSQVMQAGNRLVVLVLTGIKPPHPAELNEVEASVRSNFLQIRATELIKEKSAKAAELMKQNGDLKAAAKAVGAEVHSTDFFLRSGAIEGVGSANLLGNVFDKPVGSTFGPMSVTSQTIIGKIVDRQGADMSKFAQERDGIVLQLKAKKATERQSLLQDSVLSQLILSGKVKKHQAVIDRLIAQYRS